MCGGAGVEFGGVENITVQNTFHHYLHHPNTHSSAHTHWHACTPTPHTRARARAHTPLPHPLISLLTDLLPFHVKYLGCVWQVWRKLPWRNDFIYLTSTSSEVSVSSWERDDPKFQWEETGANPKKLECWGSCVTCYFNAGNHSW